MTKLEEDLICIGCGVAIQTENPEGAGFIPPQALAKRNVDEDDIYCQRCFRMRHYNEHQKVQVTAADFRDILTGLSKKRALILLVVDLFDLSQSLLGSLGHFVGDKPLLVAVNKVDLLPAGVKRERLKQRLIEEAQAEGLRPLDLCLVSAKQGEGLAELQEKLEHYRKGQDVYVVGTTNVGKSTLLNQVLQSAGLGQEILTTSYFPGTTLDLLEFPLANGGRLVDTPGLLKAGSMLAVVSDEVLSALEVKKRLKPKTYQLAVGQTIFIDGLAQMDYLHGEENSFTFYMSEEVYLHRRKTVGASEFYQQHAGDLLPLVPKDGVKMKHREWKLTGNQDVVLAGLGWISVKGPAVISLDTPENVNVTLRKRMI